MLTIVLAMFVSTKTFKANENKSKFSFEVFDSSPGRKKNQKNRKKLKPGEDILRKCDR